MTCNSNWSHDSERMKGVRVRSSKNHLERIQSDRYSESGMKFSAVFEGRSASLVFWASWVSS